MTADNRRAGPALLTLVVALLTVAVAAGVAFLLLRRDAMNRPAHPLSDQQSKAQVLDPAREIVSVARLHVVAGSYLLMSCNNETDPPYQGAIYVTLDMPAATGFIDQVAAALVSRGWHEPSHRYDNVAGTTVSRNGVTAVLYRDRDHDGSAIMKVYGECRNMVDHRSDPTGWVDITDQLR